MTGHYLFRFWVLVFICGVYALAFIWSRRTEPQRTEKKPTQQFCKDEDDTGLYLPCEWVKHGGEA